MGPPPKKCQNFNPQYWAGWVETPPCSCPEECRVAVSYRWLKVQMVSPAANGWHTTGRVFLGFATGGLSEVAIDKKDLTHECVVVHFKCQNCDPEFYIQYEIMNEFDGKVMNFGHYKNYEEIQASGIINHSFAFVQECYDKMWTNYATFGHNCCHWARDFSYKLRCGTMRNKNMVTFFWLRSGDEAGRATVNCHRPVTASSPLRSKKCNHVFVRHCNSNA